jgi:Leucine-rich repeat (LRR) protein
MEELEADNKAIHDLTGLEHAVNLTELSLRDNQFSFVSPLASLTNLTNLTNNSADDGSPAWSPE